MFYVVLAALFVFAMVLIFRDDHDDFSGSYNKGEDGKRSRGSSPEPKIVHPDIKTDTKKETTIRPSEYRTLSWTYLYRLEYDDSLIGDTMETEIVGMNYYITEADVGPVNGIVKAEPNNPHDHRAQLVLRADGKKLGYIPRRDLDDYEDFNEDGNICPFAGEIRMDSNGFFHADIMVALPESRDFVKEELSDYMEDDIR